MKVNEELQKEETNTTGEALTDLSVTDEQASKTTGGDTFSVNFKAIKFDYIEQKPDGGL